MNMVYTYMSFNYFNSRVENAAHKMEKYATSLEIVYEKLGQEAASPEQHR